MNNLLNTVGMKADVYEDFVDPTFELLQELSQKVPITDGGADLLEKFNSFDLCASIITHFRARIPLVISPSSNV